MHDPFAVAVQWPDEPRRYVVHLHRPYFTAALVETASAAWLLVSWSPSAGHPAAGRDAVFQAAATFCRAHLDQERVPIEFVERKHGYALPRFLLARTASQGLFIIEPEHSAPLVEVRHRLAPPRSKRSQRFDVITEWRLGQMRSYYRQFLQRQERVMGADSGLSQGHG